MRLVLVKCPVDPSSTDTMLKILTRATEKTKRSWIYMRENGVDSPYLFLHCVFSIDASPAHP